MADEPGQPDGAAVHQRHAPAPAVDAEDGICRRHPHVAPQGQLQPAGHGEPLDRGDDGLGEQHARAPEGAVAGLPQSGSGACGDGFQIRAGAENAIASGEHGNVGRIVCVECRKRLGQGVGGGAVHGVADFGAVDGDHGDAAGVSNVYGHRCFPFRRPQATSNSRGRLQGSMRMAMGVGFEPGLKRGLRMTSISMRVPMTVSALAS